MSKTIEIPYELFQEMKDDIGWLRALEIAGVDNWEGIDYASELYRQGMKDLESIG